MIRCRFPFIVISNPRSGQISFTHSTRSSMPNVVKTYLHVNTDLLFYKHDRAKQVLHNFKMTNEEKTLYNAHKYFRSQGAILINTCIVRNGHVFEPWELQ